MTITALFSIGEGPRNFLIDKDVPTVKNNVSTTAPALPPIEETMAAKEEAVKINNIHAPKTPGDMTLI